MLWRLVSPVGSASGVWRIGWGVPMTTAREWRRRFQLRAPPRGADFRAPAGRTLRSHVADVRTASIEGDFDAVVGRFVLGWVHDRVELLRACIARLRPGGLLVFQEHDPLTFYRAVPASPTIDQWRRWAQRLLDVAGIDPAFAMGLYSEFCAAGVGAPQIRYEVPIGGGPDWIGYEMLADHAAIAHDSLVQHGIASDAEMQIETLAARVRAEVVSNNGVLHTLPALGVCGRLRSTPAVTR